MFQVNPLGLDFQELINYHASSGSKRKASIRASCLSPVGVKKAGRKYLIYPIRLPSLSIQLLRHTSNSQVPVPRQKR